MVAAVETGSTVLDDRRATSLNIAAALPLSSRVAAAIRLGEIERAERLLAEPLPDAVQDSLYGLHPPARGQFHLALGRHEVAYRAFRTCGERMYDWGVDVPGLALWRVDAAEELLYGADRDEGQRLVDEQLSRAMYRLRARDAADEGGVQPIGQAGRSAPRADALASCQDLYERARALADGRGAQRGHDSRARGFIRQADMTWPPRSARSRCCAGSGGDPAGTRRSACRSGSVR